MANSKITWANKESLVTDPTIAEKNKVTDDNMNEIKSVVNENADQVILSDTEPTSTDNEIWVDTSSNATYINQEVNIGPTNPNNTPTWFKKGKNLFSSSLELGTYSNDGVKSGSTTNYRNSTPIQVQPNTTYTFSINGVSQKYGIYYYNNTNTFINSEGLTTGTFTTPANCYYINFRCFNADFTSDYANLKLQLELGAIATSYEAYVNTSIIIDGEEIYQKQEMTTSSAIVDTTYISNTEQNVITRVGQLVEFDFIFTTTGTWTSTTKMFTGLPKPNTTTKIRFVALKTNPEVPLRFQLNADGSIQNGWSNFAISSGQIIEGHITYITTD